MAAKSDDRAKRLAAALRENLRKRKAGRGESLDGKVPQTDEPTDGLSIPEDVIVTEARDGGGTHGRALTGGRR